MQEMKTALVTGAGRGIGSEIAKNLAESGFYVIVNYNGSRENAENVVNEIISSGGRAKALQCNVSDTDAVAKMTDDIKSEFGTIDVLVNNAGIVKDNLIVRMTEKDFDDVISTNLKGTFNTIKHVSKAMIKQRHGRIVNISSGFITTEMTDKLSDDVKEQMMAAIPLKRLGTTKDIADAVAFLVSDNASYITGQVIEVNGGMNM